MTRKREVERSNDDNKSNDGNKDTISQRHARGDETNINQRPEGPQVDSSSISNRRGNMYSTTKTL
jgi:hypothetical protein